MNEHELKQQFIRQALKHFPNLSEKFKELKINPQFKLNNLKGIEILPMFEEHLRIQAAGIEIEFRFSISPQEDHQFFGKISAFRIKDSETNYRSEEYIQSFLYDRQGNFKHPEAYPFSYLSLSDDEVLQEIVVETLHTALTLGTQ